MPPDRTAPPDLATAIERFLASLAARSPRTRATYQSALRRFVEFLSLRAAAADAQCERAAGGIRQPAGPPQNASGRHSARESARRACERLAGDTPWAVADLDLGLIEDYHTWLVGQYGRERRPTVVTYLAALRAFLRFLDRRGWAPPDLSFERVRARLAEVVGRGHYRTPRIDQRLPLIVLHADALPLPPRRGDPARLALLRDRALLHVLYSSGMRREEVARLNRHDLADGHRGEALITGKGDRERVVFLSDEALAAVRRYLAERDDPYAPLFLRHDRARGRPGPAGNRYRLSPQSIWQVVKRYARLAGVQATPHAFRHTKASVLLNRGAKLSEVQDILGHASPETTKRIYAHYEVAHLREAFDRFSVSPADLAATLGMPADPPEGRARRRGAAAEPPLGDQGTSAS